MLFSAFNGSTVQHLLSDSAEAKYTNKCFKKIADNQFWKCRLRHYCTNNWSMKQHWTWVHVIQLSRTNDTYHVEFDAWPKLWITFQTPPRSRMHCIKYMSTRVFIFVFTTIINSSDGSLHFHSEISEPFIFPTNFRVIRLLLCWFVAS